MLTPRYTAEQLKKHYYRIGGESYLKGLDLGLGDDLQMEYRELFRKGWLAMRSVHLQKQVEEISSKFDSFALKQ